MNHTTFSFAWSRRRREFRHLLLGAVAGALLVPAAAQAQFSFTDRTNLLSNAGFGVNENECNSGVAIGVVDLNGDGKDDIVRLHSTRFMSIETQMASNAAFGHNYIGNVGDTPWALCVGDVDHNGINDIVLGPFGGGMTLYKANATGSSFAPSTLPNSSNIDCQGTLFGDLDNDGFIDIFSCHDTGDSGKWKNSGSGVFTFTPSLMDTNLGGDSLGNYAALWTDYDNDGTIDLYLSKCNQGNGNASSPRRINRLFKNDGSSTAYTDVAPSLNLDDGSQTWSTDFADIDNDGDLDLLILNHPSSNSVSKLYENVNGTYSDITTSSGLSSHLGGFNGIHVMFDDFDNDGFVDLLISTTGGSSGYRFFRNNGNKTFTRSTSSFVVGGTTGGAGTALNYMQSYGIGDLNHDGFLDIYVGRGSGFASSTSASDVLFMNNGNGNDFLTVQLEGVISNKNAIGARVELHDSTWGVQVREVRSGEGYGIQNSLNSHFGLGNMAPGETIDKVFVRWPSGFTDELLDVAPNQFLAITETVDPGSFTTPVITSPLNVTGAINGAFSYQIGASNLPQSFSIANEPAGMTATSSGAVSWTPTSTGIFTFDIAATNPAGTDTETVTLEILSNPALALLPAIEAGGMGYGANIDSSDPWIVQTSNTHDGVDAIQNANIGDGQDSWFEVTVEGPGEASFWWRVSSEEGFDYLNFDLNGALQDRIDGTPGWAQKTFSVPVGSHAIRWTYTKDGSVSEGTDTGYVDQFSYTPDTPPDSEGDGLLDAWELANFGNLNQDETTDFDGDGQLDIAEQASGTDPVDPNSKFEVTNLAKAKGSGYRIDWSSSSGKTYKVQGSDDMETWTDVTDTIIASGDSSTAIIFPVGTGVLPVELIPEDAACFALVPTNNNYGTAWQGGDEAAFAGLGGTAGWTSGNAGVGYERSVANTYDPYLGIDLLLQMDGINSTVYIRVPFTVTDASLVTSLQLNMRYDDGFIAYLNGVEVSSANAPASPTWNSDSTQDNPDNLAQQFEPFDISSSIGDLVTGMNILAIHGLNGGTGSSDVLMEPKLTGEAVVPNNKPNHFWRVIIME